MSEVAPETPETPAEQAPEAPEATPVLQQVASSEAAPEAVPEEAPAPRSIDTVAAELLAIVDEGHKIGDRALDAVRDELRAILGA